MPLSSKPVSAPIATKAIGHAVPEDLAHELWRRSGGKRWGLEIQQFAVILESVAKKYLPCECLAAELHGFLRELRLEELALARGCANGNEDAWTEFLTRYRERLYGTAISIAKEPSRARELADGLYAELYGLKTREDGRRISKLESYTGRGSLDGWLRAILSQNYINEYRNRRNQESLEEDEEQGNQFAAPVASLPNPHLAVMNQVLEETLGDLDAESRTLLAMYYLDGQKLAAIARLLRVHESTISRKLDRLTKDLRRKLVRGLEGRGLSRQAAEEAMEADIRDLNTPVVAKLKAEWVQNSGPGTFIITGREQGQEGQSEK